jgi:hypothetical protein
MPVPQQARLPKINVRIDCGDYLLRTLKVDDASERWAGWMEDKPAAQLVRFKAVARRRRRLDLADRVIRREPHPQRSKLETTA